MFAVVEPIHKKFLGLSRHLCGLTSNSLSKVKEKTLHLYIIQIENYEISSDELRNYISTCHEIFHPGDIVIYDLYVWNK